MEWPNDRKKKGAKVIIVINWKLNFKVNLPKAQILCVIWPKISTEVFLTTHYTSVFLKNYIPHAKDENVLLIIPVFKPCSQYET